MSGGSSSGSAQPTSTTVNNVSIPSYAQPYVENTLGQGAALTDINQNPYQAYQGQQVAGFTPMQTQAFQNIANQQVAPQVTDASNLAYQVGQSGLQAYDTSGQLQNAALGYGQQGANIGVQGGGLYGAQGFGYGQQAAGLSGADIGTGMAGMNAGMSYGQNATNPAAVQAYMNPYLQATLAPAQQLLNQQYGIQDAYEQGAATKSGAFGGSREGLMQGLNEQNRMLAQNQLVGNAYNQAYNTANQNMQQAATLGMQGAQTGLAGLNAANTAYNTGIAGAGMGLQGVNAQLAGTAQGLTGVNAATNAGQYGLQGLNTSGQAASTLGNLGQEQFGQQQAINQGMLAAGTQQQALQQQGLTTQYQNYLDQLNYPYKQLSFMQGLYQGLPLSQAATSMYQAAPSLASTATGLGVAGLGAAKLMGRKGGLTDDFEVKKMASGGIASGVPAAKLDAMLGRLDDQQLALKANPKLNDPQTAQAAQSEMDFRQQMRNPGLGAAPATSMNNMAGGGIVAFAEGDQVKDMSKDEAAIQPSKTLQERIQEQKSVMPEYTAGQDYLNRLEKFTQAGAGDAEKQSAMRFLQAGLGILGGQSPYAAVNIGKGAEPAVQGAMQDVKEQQRQQMEIAKAQFEVGNMSYKAQADIVKNANEDYNKELDRLEKALGSRIAAEAAIKSAQIHAGATMGAAKEHTQSAMALAEYNKNNTEFQIQLKAQLEKAKAENGGKELTPQQIAVATSEASRAAHPSIYGSEHRADTAEELARQKFVKSYLENRGIFPLASDPDQVDKVTGEANEAWKKQKQENKPAEDQSKKTAGLPPTFIKDGVTYILQSNGKYVQQ